MNCQENNFFVFDMTMDKCGMGAVGNEVHVFRYSKHEKDLVKRAADFYHIFGVHCTMYP